MQDSQLVIEQYKTGFTPPGDVPFEDLSVLGGLNLSSSNQPLKAETTRGTVGGRTKKRTGIRGLFNTARVLSACFEFHRNYDA